MRREVEGEVGEDLRGGTTVVLGLLVRDAGKVALEAVTSEKANVQRWSAWGRKQEGTRSMRRT